MASSRKPHISMGCPVLRWEANDGETNQTGEAQGGLLQTLPLFLGKTSQREDYSDCALRLYLHALFCPKRYLAAFVFFPISAANVFREIPQHKVLPSLPPSTTPLPLSQGSIGLFRTCCGHHLCVQNVFHFIQIVCSEVFCLSEEFCSILSSLYYFLRTLFLWIEEKSQRSL